MEKLWSQINNAKFLDDESLIPEVELWLNFPTYKYIGGLLKAYLYLFILLLILEIWLMYESFTVKIFIQYAPLILIWTFITVTVGVYIGESNGNLAHMDYLKKHVLWNLEMANPLTKKKILRETFYVKCLFASHNFIVFLVVVCGIYNWEIDSVNVSLLSKKLVQLSPDYAALINKMCAPLICSTFLPISSCFWYHLYALFLGKFQIYMLIDYFQLVENNSVLSITDANYQVKVKKFLTFFIKRHQTFIECLEIFGRTSGLIATYIIFSFLVSLYSIFALYSHKYGYFIDGLPLFAYFFLAITVTHACQHYQNTMLDLLEQIRNLKWYNWNNDLRKMYLIIYIYSSVRIERLPLPSYVDCNYEVLKKCLKFFYSATNFYRAMK